MDSATQKSHILESIKKTNENIFLTLTINIVIATSINSFVSPNIFNNKLAPITSGYYSISIIALVACYIVLQSFESIDHSNFILGRKLFGTDIGILVFQYILNLNIFLSSLTLLIVGTPIVINNISLNSLLLEICIGFNMVIPCVFFVFLIILRFFYSVIPPLVENEFDNRKLT
jgi:hypothetical protein